MPDLADIIIIGAGIAGASAAYELSRDHRVILLEMEGQPGYHSTGRSVAIFSETYGPPQIRALSRASRAFFEQPPENFAAGPLLSPRGTLSVAREDQVETLRREQEASSAFLSSIDPAEALKMVPVLRPDYVAAALIEEGVMEIDVHALHSGYIAAFRRNGGTLVTDAEARGISRAGRNWLVDTRQGAFEAPVLVNAAGAWGDRVAGLAGVAPCGLVPKRRTAFVFDAPQDVSTHDWPMVVDADEEFYFKPDAGRLVGSPADATPVEPQDVQPEDIDVATAAWRIEQATTMEIGAIGRRWAGLRSFVADGSPAIGFDRDEPGFFWLVGQGGYGIQSAPGAGKFAAGLVRGGAVELELARHGVEAGALAPERATLRSGS